MKNKCMLTRLIFSLMVFPVLVPGAALSFERYDYDRIKEDFSGYSCPKPQGTPEKPVTYLSDNPLTLKAALDMALKNNPDTQIAVARVEQSKAMLQKAKAAFLPSLNAYTEYTRGDFPSGFLFKTIDQRLFVNGTNFNDPGIIENFETGISSQMTLFNGGRNILGHAMAKEDLAMTNWDSISARNTVAAQLITAWYDSLSAGEFVKIAEESMVTVKNQLDIMTVLFEGGSALRSDILSLNVRLAQAEEELLKSRNRYKLATAALSTILGVFPNTELLIDTAPFSLSNTPETYEKGMAIALSNRPELNKIRALVRKSRMAKDMARSSFLPTANLMGKYYVDDPSMDYSRDRENWAVGLMLNWNLFSGFSDRAGNKISDAQLKEALFTDKKAVLSVSFDVKNAYIRFDEATARINVAQRSVLMSEESLSLVKKQYEGGSATITRYLEVELDRNTAKIRATSAHYDREKAIADIARSTGLLSKPKALISQANKEIDDEKK